MRPRTTASWPCAAAWEQEQEAKAQPLSLESPHPTRMTVMTTHVLDPSGAPQAVSRCPRGCSGWGCVPAGT